MRFELYKDKKKEWRWRFISNRVIAKSSESYKNKSDCVRGIELMQSSKAAKIMNLEDQSKTPKIKIVKAKAVKPKDKKKK